MAQSCYLLSNCSKDSAPKERRRCVEEVMHNKIPKYMVCKEEKVEPTSLIEEIKLRNGMQKN